jgi:HPt (histidine-containing phosphotransfer) domain-containing protein
LDLKNKVLRVSNHEVPISVVKIVAENNVPENTSSVDLVYLKQISNNNTAFIMQMIEMFLQKTPEAIDEMNEKFQKQNWMEVSHIAHRMKPSYIYVGLKDIHKLLAEIEQCSKENPEPDKIHNLIEEVETKSRMAFEDLEKELVHLK